LERGVNFTREGVSTKVKKKKGASRLEGEGK